MMECECAIRGMLATVSLPIPHILLKNPSRSTLVMVGAEATAGSVVLAALDLSGTMVAVPEECCVLDAAQVRHGGHGASVDSLGSGMSRWCSE